MVTVDLMAKHLSERCTESCPLHAREVNAQAVHLEQRLGQHHGLVMCQRGLGVGQQYVM